MIHISEQEIQRSVLKIFLSYLLRIGTLYQDMFDVIILLYATQTGGSCFFQNKGMHQISILMA